MRAIALGGEAIKGIERHDVRVTASNLLCSRIARASDRSTAGTGLIVFQLEREERESSQGVHIV